MSFHREHQPHQPLNTRMCRFCQERDPNFANRKFEDGLVRSSEADAARSHISENGHVFHLMIEVALMRQQRRETVLVNCA